MLEATKRCVCGKNIGMSFGCLTYNLHERGLHALRHLQRFGAERLRQHLLRPLQQGADVRLDGVQAAQFAYEVEGGGCGQEVGSVRGALVKEEVEP